MVEIKELYRNKPKQYWDEILEYKDGLMEIYIKDNSGHSENLINGKINGLFFSGRLRSSGSKFPISSPFGGLRLKVDCTSILDPKKHNFYFADFYCNSTVHYVTIVVCVIGSHTDEYCKNNLIKIDKFNNQFINCDFEFCHRKFFINNNIWIEIFYTEDIDIRDKKLKKVRATGARSSKVNGVPNNKCCRICNL